MSERLPQAHDTIVVYHVTDGAHEFPNRLDGHVAVRMHPNEWSYEPWTPEQEEHGQARRLDAGATAFTPTPAAEPETKGARK